ncbi:hypothetical protein CLOM_g19252 [Closterium sp. NIES-68]|nr:hypothetical protein CLOM_g19252 [Closterium sp. NIES-68]
MNLESRCITSSNFFQPGAYFRVTANLLVLKCDMPQRRKLRRLKVFRAGLLRRKHLTRSHDRLSLVKIYIVGSADH